MCDEGRFGLKYMHAEERLTVPELQAARRQLVSRDWDAVLAAVRNAARCGGARIRNMASPACFRRG